MRWQITPLCQLLVGFRHFNATNPLHKVFALLGLIVNTERPHPLLHPDYEMSFQELMSRTLRHCIAAKSYFDVSSFVGIGHAPTSNSESKATGMLSWAADWTLAALHTPLHVPRSRSFSRTRYGATGEVSSKPVFGAQMRRETTVSLEARLTSSGYGANSGMRLK